MNEGNSLYKIIFKITVRDKNGNVCEGYSPEYVSLNDYEHKAWEDYITKFGARPNEVNRLKDKAVADTLTSWNTSLKYKATPISIEEG